MQLEAIQPIIVVFPQIIQLPEMPVSEISERFRNALRQRFREVFECVSYRAVHVPLLYVILQHVFLVSNAAWFTFLVDGLGFTISQTGMLGMIAVFSGMLSLVLYGACLEAVNWRYICLGAVLLGTFFSAANLLLILRVNVKLGIPDFVFAAGDDVLSDVIVSFFTVPNFRMMNLMCPKGSEGVSYAMLSSASNMGYTVSSSIGALLTHVWDVSNEAMKEKRFDGLLKLQLLSCILPLLPLPLVFLIPRNTREQLTAMAKGIRNNLYGWLVLLWIVFGLIYTMGTAAYIYRSTPAYY